MNPDSDQRTIADTQAWLNSLVIAQNLCPFAKREAEQDRIRYSVCADNDWQSGLEHLISECCLLDVEPKIATTLLIFSDSLKHFDDYLDFLAIAEQLLDEEGYTGVYQLASFHPDYCFDGAPADDPANYTNRAPYPTLHLLREASMAKALASYPNPEQIPERNIALTRKLGLAKMQTLLAACYGHN
ncbi:DUF1415 domain-containing protein [Methylosoma difficile]